MLDRGEIAYVPCCTESCFDELRKLVGVNCFQELQDQGLFEYSTIQGRGTICKVLELAEKYNLSKVEVYDIIVAILDKGLVVFCPKDGTKVVASVEKYLQYADALGLTTSNNVPA